MNAAALPSRLAIIDVETTGLDPQRDRLWEIAVVQVDDGCLVARQHWLVNPGIPLPPRIEALCQISHAELRLQPSLAEIAPALNEALRGRTLVAHNLRFDAAFLRRALPGKLPSRGQLCTLSLARQCLPNAASHSLEALCQQLGIAHFAAHRAPSDAEATWQLLQHLWPLRPNQSAPAVRHELNLAALPQRPGVYYFYGEHDALLYIGKSRQLRQRVHSHFYADHHSRRQLQMTQQVRRIAVTPCAGELGALLLEAAEIQRLQPLYNRLLRRQRRLFSWHWDSQTARLQLLSHDDAGAASSGVFRSPKQARTWLQQQAKHAQLCPQRLGLSKGHGACFAVQLGQCLGVCCGQESPASHDERLLACLASRRRQAWPWPGPIAIAEHDREHRLSQWHVVHDWRYLGSVKQRRQVRQALKQTTACATLDSYHILLRHLQANPTCEVIPL
ncbi:DNA polymerase-3 subunit epsilon [Atopomonas hussainii]|uniref:Excinuclease cho n=1 Tax=Atopomonas hussainii TaxID=1429083 RepID=A0A1H7NCR6_9GAMM|nr:3'-5' exonuclease family protein [Atopomonas hussainii]SEL21386.1 DNA polymerase-3 subunit epsilon [Atopomonas hussainii]